MTYTTDTGIARIVVEYDGFDHHFLKGKEVNVGNHERYMLESDIERQLTLESYGYRFLRINRFNLGTDPVRTLSDRLKRLVESLTFDHSVGSVQNMQDQAAGLASKELKTCSRCKKIKPQDAFFDKTLKNGDGANGRLCMTCKTDAAAADVQKRQSGGQRTRSRRWRRWR